MSAGPLPDWNDLPQAVRVRIMRDVSDMGCAPCCADAMCDAALQIYATLREALAEPAPRADEERHNG